MAANPQWIKDEIDRLHEEYGTVPPPWILYNGHPYSIYWRMAGEWHMEMFWTWWREQGNTRNEHNRIEYFRQFSPPARWLKWMIDAVWDPQILAGGRSDNFDYSPYFARLEALGFGSQEDFERDFKAVSRAGSDVGSDVDSDVESDADSEKEGDMKEEQEE